MIGIFFQLFCICFSIVCLRAVETANLPEPYSKLETVLPFNPQGWYSNQRRIEEIFKQNHILTVVEVGSWLGASTRHIAKQLPPGGVVFAVDHWLGSVEHQGCDLIPTLYEQFLSNVIHAGLTDKIIPIRMDSLAAAQYLKSIPVDLVYLDGAHDKQSVLNDLEAWFPFVAGHGVICGDDYTWDSVKEAVREFAKKNHLKVMHKHCFWRLIEK